MGIAERRVEYQGKISATRSALSSLHGKLEAAAMAAWICAGAAVLSLAMNHLAIATLGVMAGAGAWAWRSGLQQENGRLSSYLESLTGALRSLPDEE